MDSRLASAVGQLGRETVRGQCVMSSTGRAACEAKSIADTQYLGSNGITRLDFSLKKLLSLGREQEMSVPRASYSPGRKHIKHTG